MRIVVTGSAGYLGSMLASDLLAQGHSVVGIDSLMHGGRSVAGLVGNPQFTFLHADLREQAVVAPALRGAEALVHLAAIVGEPACNRDPDLTRAVNFEASVSLVNAARAAGVERFVFASTCSNYGKMPDASGYVDETSPLQPLSVYAETKVALEKHLLESPRSGSFIPTVLRLSTVYGLSFRPRFDLTVNEFAAEAAVNRKLVVFGEQFWRPYVHVRDVSRAVTAVLGAPMAAVQNAVFNVGGTDENYTKKMLVDLILERLPDTNVEFVKRDADPRDYRVRFRKIGEQLGFRPSLTVPRGLDEVITAIRTGVIADFTCKEYRN
jgi:nucleoside-diphosphate-sugar epimerase